MAAALEAKGLDHELHLYEGEDHGFRRAETERAVAGGRTARSWQGLGGRLSRLVSELNLILIGPPGAGKGTQAENIKEDFDLPYLATGDMMRAARKEDSDLGRKIDKIINEGGLVDDDIVCEVLIERIDSEGEDGFLLDGFPRTERPGRHPRRRAGASAAARSPPSCSSRRPTRRSSPAYRPPPVPRRPRLPPRVQPAASRRASATSTARSSSSATTTSPRRSRSASRPTTSRPSRWSSATTTRACCAASTAPSRPTRSTRTCATIPRCASKKTSDAS